MKILEVRKRKWVATWKNLKVELLLQMICEHPIKRKTIWLSLYITLMSLVTITSYCKVKYTICLTLQFFFFMFLSFNNITPPHMKEVLSDVLLDLLLDWNMNRKISTITVDNYASNDEMIDILLEKLSLSNSLLLNGKVFHIWCKHMSWTWLWRKV